MPPPPPPPPPPPSAASPVASLYSHPAHGPPPTAAGVVTSPAPPPVSAADGNNAAEGAPAIVTAPGEYLTGRLPAGVGFAALPGRAATPLPTASSKGAERLRQLQIWNEAATAGEEERRRNTVPGTGAAATAGGAERRTDDFHGVHARQASAARSEGSGGLSGRGASGGVDSREAMFADADRSSDEEDGVESGG
eukprot:TRINITY_DN2471_c0_g1_i14.p2 TRINITY_DN2471_c0_g1~~TRINITY_DN2471_c0_g1_i14.p2  ORF type:complete len:194 (-),score=32.21 TRINITY_DN2471_c0_g1_i14:620-1201(-)